METINLQRPIKYISSGDTRKYKITFCNSEIDIIRFILSNHPISLLSLFAFVVFSCYLLNNTYQQYTYNFQESYLQVKHSAPCLLKCKTFLTYAHGISSHPYCTFFLNHDKYLWVLRYQGVIRIRKSKKDRQYNGQMKKEKRTNNDLQNIHIKLKIE